MTSITTVGVDDDFAAREASVALWATDHEATGWVDVELGVLGDELRWHDWLDDQFADGFFEVLLLDVFVMLGRHHDGFDANWGVTVVAHRNLGFAVRAQPVDALMLRLAHVSEPLRQLVRELDRQRHQFGGFGASVTKHQALVASALFRRVAAINALRDVWRLLFNSNEHAAGGCIKAHSRAGETNFTHSFARDLLVIHRCFGGDFTGDHHKTGLREGFASDAAVWVLCQTRIEHAVRNSVAQLVWVSFGD